MKYTTSLLTNQKKFKVFDGYRLIHISCNIFQNIGELLNVVALSDTGSVMLNMGEKNRMGEENKFHQL